MNKKFISWMRVSTFKQNRSGLGLDAQKEIIRYFVERDGGNLIADYAECYTGKDLGGCVELRKAMAHAKKEKAVLIIAKSDRFRNTIEALQIYEEMGDGNIMFCDLPHTDKFTLTLFFALAEREALIVSIRTKQALQALKERGGVKIGAASEKYIENRLKKDKRIIKENDMKRGQLRRQRYFESRDTQAFLRVLRNVFPDATDGEPKVWQWGKINCKEENREKMLALMADYKGIDEGGLLFCKWDFSDHDASRRKLISYLQAFRKSVMGK